MSKTNNIAVRFLKRWRAYNPDEVAGFEPEVAEKLVDGGAAEYADKARTKGSGKKSEPKKAEAGGTEKQPPDGSGGTGQGDLDDDARP